MPRGRPAYDWSFYEDAARGIIAGWLDDQARPPTVDELHQALVDRAVKLSRNDWPGRSKVADMRRSILGQEPGWERDYRIFRWPESMVRGDLPWEASAAALELVGLPPVEEAPDVVRVLSVDASALPVHPAYRLVLRLPMFSLDREPRRGGRPLVRLVRWFWRVTQAAPIAPAGWREGAARVLTVAEILDAAAARRTGPPDTIGRRREHAKALRRAIESELMSRDYLRTPRSRRQRDRAEREEEHARHAAAFAGLDRDDWESFVSLVEWALPADPEEV